MSYDCDDQKCLNGHEVSYAIDIFLNVTFLG